MQKTVLVAGFGNPLMGDDGIGPHAVARLENMALPPHVELIDAGTSSLDLVPFVDGKKRAVFIDAVRAGGVPGTIYRISADELEHPAQSSLSLHQLRLVDAIMLWDLHIERPQDITLLGVEPLNVDLSLDLSPPVAAALPRLCELVLELVNKNG